MEFRQLLYFQHIFEAGSFSKAARELDVTQQGLSLSINKLESELGVIFFTRSKNGVEPTKIAVSFKEDVDYLLSSFDDLKIKIQAMGRAVNGVVKIALTPGSVVYVVPKLHTEFHDIYPHIELDITEMSDSDCAKALLSEEIDVACAMGPVKTKRIEWVPFMKDDVKIIMSKKNPLSSRDNLTFADLKNEQFIMPPEGYDWHRFILGFCKTAGYQPNISYVTGDISLTYSLIKEGRGIAFVNSDIASTFRTDENVQIAFSPDVEFHFSLGLMRIHNKQPGYAASLLFDYLRESGKLSGWKRL